MSEICIGFRLNMAKYARPRSLSSTANHAYKVRFYLKTEGGHISPYLVYNLFITYFTIKFTFCKVSRIFEMFNIVSDSGQFVLKRSRRDFVESKQHANIAGK